MISFETGLLLQTKGLKIVEEAEFMGETGRSKAKWNLIYLDIPLTVRASFDIGGAKIYSVFGPYVGMGLSGKIKTESSYMGETEKEQEDINWGNNEDDGDLKRLDFGLTIGTGVEINAIQIGISYSLGLANISNFADDGTKISNRVLAISAGYNFGGNAPQE
ncbi:MAG: PorT family protein [Maribacter sp.]|nr:PorT family protein [Maribacter sp.]